MYKSARTTLTNESLIERRLKRYDANRKLKQKLLKAVNSNEIKKNKSSNPNESNGEAISNNIK